MNRAEPLLISFRTAAPTHKHPLALQAQPAFVSGLL